MQRGTILLVENIPSSASAVKSWLTDEGFFVITASDCSETVAIVNNDPNTIDLVLMDTALGSDAEFTDTAYKILKEHDIPLLLLYNRSGTDISARTGLVAAYGLIDISSGQSFLTSSVKMALRLSESKRQSQLHDGRRENSYQEAINRSEEKFRRLVENAPVPITVSQKGFTIYSNSVFASMLGFDTVEEILGKHLSEYAAPEYRDFTIDLVNRRDRGEPAPLQYEITAVRKNGERFPMLVQVNRAMMPEGMTTIASFIDLTEHYRINQALWESEERLRFVLEGGNIGYWDWNIVSGEVSRNEQWAKMLGYTYEEIKNSVKQWLDFVHPDDRERAWNSINAHLDGSASMHEIEYRMQSKSGDYIWISDRAMITMRNADGKPLRMSGIHMDVTDSKTNQLRLQQYAEELKNLNALKDRLFSIISHDLRGPFSGFIGLTHELATNIESLEREDIASIASVMHASAKETSKLLLNLLEWSRVQTGSFEMDPTEICLFTETENIKKLFSSGCALKMISLKNNIPKAAPVNTYKNVLQTVLRNLIDNAIKFTPEGGMISISAEFSRGFLEIAVTDSGTGIDPESIEKIFSTDKIYTSLGTNGEKGSGLGLTLCSELLSRCGGAISVRNCKNEGYENSGTEFKFTLPLVQR